MKIVFRIAYKVAFGEQVMLNVINRCDDGSAEWQTYGMMANDGEHWSYQVESARIAKGSYLEYAYSVNRGDRQVRRECSTLVHRLFVGDATAASYDVQDLWEDTPDDIYLYSKAFVDCLNRRQRNPLPSTRFASTVRLVARAPQLKPCERLAVVGDTAYMGAWLTSRAIPMEERSTGEWTADLDASAFVGQGVQYKYVALNDNDDNAVKWETGANRALRLMHAEPSQIVVHQDWQAHFDTEAARFAGTAVPVFALRSANGCGVGDFGDLKQLIDWAAATHQRVVQLLPLNDTRLSENDTEFYPYRCISAFALHPLYIDVRQLPPLANPVERKRFEQLWAELDALPQLDYARVLLAKTEYLRALYAQEGGRVLRSAAYRRFFASASAWLVPYARYCHLRKQQGTCHFSAWKGHEQWHESERAKLENTRSKAHKDLAPYFFVQFLLDKQLCEVHEYARLKGVAVKGDLAFGVHRWACDVWQNPQYFDATLRLGAPPDAFSPDGQDWDMPAYNWQKMAADDFKWWQRRLLVMSRHFDAYRMDHVLGFFRMWTIPQTAVSAQLGQFTPAIGLTREEIESYGLRFQERLYTRHSSPTRCSTACLATVPTT